MREALSRFWSHQEIPELLDVCLAVWPQLSVKTSSWSVGQLHVVDNLVAGFDLTLGYAISNHDVRSSAQQNRFEYDIAMHATWCGQVCVKQEGRVHEGCEMQRLLRR